MRQLKPEEVRQLSPLERMSWVKNICIIYPRLQSIIDRIKRYHASQVYAKEPRGFAVLGDTGVGKSTIIEICLQLFPSVITNTKIVRPALSFVMPSNPTEKKVVTALLHAAGDPLANSGSAFNQTIRLERIFTECGITLLFTDELQHLIDRENERVLKTVTDWYKRFLKKTCVISVFIGMPDAQKVIDVNPQLKRLFGKPRILEPFTWDYNKSESTEEFRNMLALIEQVLPLRLPSRLADPEMAERCFDASGGVMGHLMTLIRISTLYALERGSEQLTPEILAETFEDELSDIRYGIKNPFQGFDSIQ